MVPAGTAGRRFEPPTASSGNGPKRSRETGPIRAPIGPDRDRRPRAGDASRCAPSGWVRDHHQSELGHVLDGPAHALAAEAAVLHAAVGHVVDPVRGTSLTMTPPTSSASKARQACARSFVKTPALEAEAAVVDLGQRILEVAERERHDERRERLLRAHLGAAGSASTMTVGGNQLPSARAPDEDAGALGPRPRAPSARVRAAASARPSARGRSTGPSGRPSAAPPRPATKRSMNASQIDSWTSSRCTLMQTWPLYAKAPTRQRLTAQSRSARGIDDGAGVAAQLEDDLLLAGSLLHPPADAGEPVNERSLKRSSATMPVAQLPRHRQHRHGALRAGPTASMISGDREHRERVARSAA